MTSREFLIAASVAVFLLACQVARAAEVTSYGKVFYDGTSVVVESDSGDFTASVRGRTFQLDFRRDMRDVVVTTGASAPYIDAPYISVEAVGASDREPRQLEFALIRNGDKERFLNVASGSGSWLYIRRASELMSDR